MKRIVAFLSLFAVCLSLSMSTVPSARAEEKQVMTMIVMDPLSAPLSCDCVKGYAQRDYEKLAKYLEQQLNISVQVHFAESLAAALERKSQGKADLIIGKHSVIAHQGPLSKLSLKPIASLTGKDGSTTQTGLIVVPNKDAALTVADLKGYRILFGSTDCDEKYQAALYLLKDNEVAVPPKEKHETCAACSDGATAILDMHKNGVKAAAVISSYAKPLLEGCGTIKKGDLRVVGETEPVAFITAFINEKLPTAEQHRVQEALLKVSGDTALLAALETKAGFVAYQVPSKKK
ncbi:MAG TPA: PhnD/SsuA/transferrin family substrate-binding protein [Gemmatales bacterium]|nr:PhnD/SsuA/transferrin family substrate-binding protein [Gemmatales bacterium]